MTTTNESDACDRVEVLRRSRTEIIPHQSVGHSSDDGGGEKTPRTTYWRSIYIASALSFTGSAQFTLYFSSLWPYLQVIDRSITESFFGYIIAVYSVGQILASPALGYLSNRMGKVCENSFGNFPFEIIRLWGGL